MSIDEIQSQITEILKNMKESIINVNSYRGVITIDLDNIKSKLKKMSYDKKYTIYESFINVKLINISNYKGNTKKVLNSISIVAEYLEFFIASKYEEILYESAAIGEEFVLKAINYKNRDLKMPIKIDLIKDYSIRCGVKESSYDLLFIIILLELDMIYSLLSKNAI